MRTTLILVEYSCKDVVPCLYRSCARYIDTKKMHTRRNERENEHVLLNTQLLLTRTYTFYCKPWVMARYDSKTRNAKLYYCTAYGVSVMQFSVTKLPRSYSDKKERRGWGWGLDWREKEMKELTHVHCLDSQSVCMRAFWLQLECVCVYVCITYILLQARFDATCWLSKWKRTLLASQPCDCDYQLNTTW